MWSALTCLVKPDHVLIHVGDVALGSRSELQDVMSRLPGCRKFLVEGNHDKRSKIRRFPQWESITRYQDTLHVSYRGLRIAITHRMEDMDTVGVQLAIHGHIHERGSHVRWIGDLMIVNACVEQWHYVPINLGDLIGTMIPRKEISDFGH